MNSVPLTFKDVAQLCISHSRKRQGSRPWLSLFDPDIERHPKSCQDPSQALDDTSFSAYGTLHVWAFRILLRPLVCPPKGRKGVCMVARLGQGHVVSLSEPLARLNRTTPNSMSPESRPWAVGLKGGLLPETRFFLVSHSPS